MKFQLIAGDVAVAVSGYFTFLSQFPTDILPWPFHAVTFWVSINIIAWVARKAVTRSRP